MHLLHSWSLLLTRRVRSMGPWLCGPRVWCLLVSTVLWPMWLWSGSWTFHP
ncbi:hypothetical protein Taro_027468 [Colocasia esculenta]|uniref:Uncharacterized protein n=1 Tax=Colocasia esculenta TaxID=4460 RepID=A0A843VUF6_COLES|nr:hypothetical protein [Colocasia esculenta]